MIKYKYVNSDNMIISKNHCDLNSEYIEDSDDKRWIDITTENQNLDQITAFLEKNLNLDPLVVKDTFRERHPPKIEFFDNYIFILYRGITHFDKNLAITHQQIAFFVFENMLVTVHPHRSIGINNIVQRQDLSELLKNPLLLAQRILHNSASVYLENILEFENELSLLEDQLDDKTKSENALASLSFYRTKLIKLKRVFNYHQRLSNALKNHALHSQSQTLKVCEHYIIDLDDIFERLNSLTQMQYEMCGDMIDSYISITSHQLNVTMRILTVVTTIFVPLSFLAGLYGMNFDNIPELHYKSGYFILLGIMGLITLILITGFKIKKWF